MRRGMFILWFITAAACPVPAVADPQPAHAPLTDAELTDAIGRIQQHLLSIQDPDTGGWDDRYATSRQHRGGETALVMFALLRSGISVQDERMQAATNFLQEVEMGGTYAISLRAHCWAALSDDYRTRLAADARWLINAQTGGLFDYGPRTGPRFDHSVTQYGLLGLWESSKRRGPTAVGIWRQAAQHFIDIQNPDGGWGYQDSKSTPSMTAAGLTALLIAQENLYRSRNTPPEQVTLAINGGVAWLDHHAAAEGVTTDDTLYYLVSLERAALANGIKTLGGHDWFQSGARDILNHERGRGKVGDLTDTAFALIFLSRGRVPVWINKLRLPDQPWNNRPNDLTLLTRELSEIIEAEMNWQVIATDADVTHWLNAPVAYVAADRPVSLNAVSRANLKTYLDLGGMLVATPDNEAQGFDRSIRRLAAELYPKLSFQRIGPGHPLLGLVYQVDITEDQRPWVLTNGARDLIVLSSTDWGMPLQSGLDAKRTGARDIMANLHAQVTDRAGALDRMGHTPIPRSDRPVQGVLHAARVDTGGQDPLEPRAWQPMTTRFFNRTGYDLDTRALQAERIGESDPALAHLGGVTAQPLTPTELRAMTEYIRRGGTVLIENIGGRGAYSADMLRQFEAVLGETAVPIRPDHPVVTGVGLGHANQDAGYDLRRLGYRRWSNLNRGPIDSPRLLVLNLEGRAAVIASHEDISLGVLGVTHWGIDGYDVEPARQLLSNILLYAARSRPPEPPPAATEADGGVRMQNN